MCKITIKTYNILHKAAGYLAIFPVIDARATGTSSNFVFVLLNLTILTAIYVYITYTRYVVFYDKMASTAYYGYLLSDMLMAGQNIHLIINTCLRREEILKMIQCFEELSSVLKDVPIELGLNERFRRRYYVELVSCHIMCGIYAALNFYEWNEIIGYEMATVALLKDIFHYYLLMFGILLWNLINLIKYHTILLKLVIKDLSLNKSRTTLPTIDKSKQNLRLVETFSVPDLQKTFGIINEIIAHFNKIFGWSVVEGFANVLLNTIIPINMLLLYGRGNKELLGAKFDYLFNLIVIMWTLFPLSRGLFLASACQQTVDEIKEIPKLCYDLAHKVDIATKTQLNEFATEINVLNPQFEAAGLFTVNYGVFTSMSTAIISYIIVLIQFNHLE